MKYLLRLDDACPTMHQERWHRIESILDYHSIQPMVGVIPHNEDPQQNISSEDSSFWNKVRYWESKGWAIALHGYNHCYTSTDSGINPIWNRSEFAGLSLEEQKEKIRKGIEIFKSNGVNPKYFFAPSHTFDLNTLKALEEGSAIRVISDTISIKPYTQHGFTFIPQLGGMPRKIPIDGIWTFCLHPSIMKDEDFIKVERFILDNKSLFTSFDKLNLTNLKSKDLMSKILSFTYFTIRKIRKIK